MIKWLLALTFPLNSFYIPQFVLYAHMLIWSQGLSGNEQQRSNVLLKDPLTGVIAVTEVKLLTSPLWDWHCNHWADIMPTLSNILPVATKWNCGEEMSWVVSCSEVCLRPESPPKPQADYKLYTDWLLCSFYDACRKYKQLQEALEAMLVSAF